MNKEDYLTDILIQLNSGFGLFIIHKNVYVCVCVCILHGMSVQFIKL